jgi:hypothetical protein
MQYRESKNPVWLFPLKIAGAVVLLTFIAGGIIPYWGYPTKDVLHTVPVHGRHFTAFLTPDQYLWYHWLSTYGLAMIVIWTLVFIAFAFTLRRRG